MARFIQFLRARGTPFAEISGQTTSIASSGPLRLIPTIESAISGQVLETAVIDTLIDQVMGTRDSSRGDSSPKGWPFQIYFA